MFFVVVILVAEASVAFLGWLFHRFETKAWYIVIAVVCPFVVLGILIETAAHIYAYRNPSYDVLYLQPDRAVGWKMVPGLHFTWAGPHCAAFEFSVPTVANSRGF